MTPPTCPYCNAQSAVPILGLADKVGSVFKTLFSRTAGVASFANADYVRQFENGQIEAVCTRCGKRFKSTADVNRPVPRAAAPPRPAVAERLRELEALHSQGLVTDDEYREQRRRILADL